MFEVLIREAAARFGVGDKALPLVQILLAAMTAKDAGGLAGFLEKFKAAGLGPLVQSWLGGGDGAQPIGNSQVEAVLGTSGGLLPALTAHLGLPRDQITEAIGYLLPALVGRLTPGGSLPATLSPDVASYAQAGQGLLVQAARAVQAMQRASAGGGGKWRMWAIVAVIVLVALYAWRASHRPAPAAAPEPERPAADAFTPAPPPAPHTQPLTPGAAFGGHAPREEPASAAPDADSAASAADAATSATSATSAASATN